MTRPSGRDDATRLRMANHRVPEIDEFDERDVVVEDVRATRARVVHDHGTRSLARSQEHVLGVKVVVHETAVSLQTTQRQEYLREHPVESSPEPLGIARVIVPVEVRRQSRIGVSPVRIDHRRVVDVFHLERVLDVAPVGGSSRRVTRHARHARRQPLDPRHVVHDDRALDLRDVSRSTPPRLDAARVRRRGERRRRRPRRHGDAGERSSDSGRRTAVASRRGRGRGLGRGRRRRRVMMIIDRHTDRSSGASVVFSQVRGVKVFEIFIERRRGLGASQKPSQVVFGEGRVERKTRSSDSLTLETKFRVRLSVPPSRLVRVGSAHASEHDGGVSRFFPSSLHVVGRRLFRLRRSDVGPRREFSFAEWPRPRPQRSDSGRRFSRLKILESDQRRKK